MNSDNYTNTRRRFYHEIPMKSLLKIYTTYLAMTIQWKKWPHLYTITYEALWLSVNSMALRIMFNTKRCLCIICIDWRYRVFVDTKIIFQMVISLQTRRNSIANWNFIKIWRRHIYIRTFFIQTEPLILQTQRRQGVIHMKQGQANLESFAHRHVTIYDCE